MTFGRAILLGLVQGIAEFLPISSSGHLAILQNLFNMSDLENGHLLFDVLLHFGTLVAICFVYWKDIKAMVLDTLGLFSRAPQTRSGAAPGARLLIMLAFASVPLFLVLPVHDYIESLTSSSVFIGIALILTGCMLFVSDKLTPGTKNQGSMRIKDALIIGLCQVVATLPGLSRSGTTITAGIATGMDRQYAVRFSILMSLPAVLGATFLELIKTFKTGVDLSLVPAYLVGMLTAAVTGVLSIWVLKLIAKRSRFSGFSYYCWVVGVLTIILALIF